MCESCWKPLLHVVWSPRKKERETEREREREREGNLKATRHQYGANFGGSTVFISGGGDRVGGHLCVPAAGRDTPPVHYVPYITSDEGRRV